MPLEFELKTGLETLGAPEKHEETSGKLGAVVSGVFTVIVPKDPSMFYVRFPLGRFVAAKHDGKFAPTQANIEVEIYKDPRDPNNDWHIRGLESNQAGAYIQGNDTIYTPADVIVHGDIVGDSGLVYKSGSETYRTIKTNIGAGSDPTASDDSNGGWSVGSLWITATKTFIAHAVTVGSAVWEQLGGAGNSFFNQNLTAQIDGSNQTFLLPFAFFPGSTLVYQNGTRLRLSSDYVESGSFTQVILTDTPQVGDDLIADGVKA